MIRDMLPNMTDKEFREVMEITTDDIRENRTKFGKETDLEEMLTIAKRSLRALRKCNKVIERSREMENRYIKISFEGSDMGIETSKDGVDNDHVLCAIVGLVDMAKDFGLNMEAVQKTIKFACNADIARKSRIGIMEEAADGRFKI